MGGIGSGRKARDKSKSAKADYKPARNQKSEEEQIPKQREFSVPVTAFRFAKRNFVTVPGEFYSTLLPQDTAAICSANGYYRYIADEHAYEAGHYEALAAIVAKGSGEILSNTIRQLLEKL